MIEAAAKPYAEQAAAIGGFDGFRDEIVVSDGVRIACRIGGSGPALVCLHGYPETHLMWHRVAGPLSEHFTVIAPDLRGYGASDCPPDDDDHTVYAKRAMARDVIATLDHLGFAEAAVVGHDRGARVAYRLAIDWPERVTRLSVLDVIPTSEVWDHMTRASAVRLYHWTLLAQPVPLPEDLLASDPDTWIANRFRRGAPDLPDWLEADVLSAYQAAFRDPARRSASCADYRAGATIDVIHDRADLSAGRRVQCPLQAIWGSRGNLQDIDDPLAVWDPWSKLPVVGTSIASGHFLAEEAPQALLEHLLLFLREA
ncbi:MAG: alpha/beta hydrolase [Pseudomonadota bacterium]